MGRLGTWGDKGFSWEGGGEGGLYVHWKGVSPAVAAFAHGHGWLEGNGVAHSCKHAPAVWPIAIGRACQNTSYGCVATTASLEQPL